MKQIIRENDLLLYIDPIRNLICLRDSVWDYYSSHLLIKAYKKHLLNINMDIG